MRSRSLSVLAVLLLTGPLAGAELVPRLVKDINTIPQAANSLPSDDVTVGGVTFFAADDGDTGRELWRTDGTPGGTYRLTDACPGGVLPQPDILFHRRQYLFLPCLRHQRGSQPVGERRHSGHHLQAHHRLHPVAGPQPAPMVAASGSPPLRRRRRDPWQGALAQRRTPGGTYQVADLWPGPQESRPRNMVVFKDRVYFTADDGQRGPALWKSDGTPQGTQAVRDPVPGSASHAAPEFLRVAGGNLFVAPTPARGVQLWRSDGTTRGTAPLTDLRPNGGAFLDFAVFGNRLLFVADDGRSGQETMG